MAYSRLSMRKIFEVLRLSVADGRSHREIARAIIASPTTVGEILRRAKLAGLTYPLPSGLSEAAVEALLYPPSAPSRALRPEPDWAGVHRELRRKGVTLDLLWQEYKGEHPDGYQYSSCWYHDGAWAGRLSVSLRQTNVPGEKLFVDYAGPTVPVTDPLTGEIVAEHEEMDIFPAKHFVTTSDRMQQAIAGIEKELAEQLEIFRSQGKILEAARLEERTHYDLSLIHISEPTRPY